MSIAEQVLDFSTPQPSQERAQSGQEANDIQSILNGQNPVEGLEQEAPELQAKEEKEDPRLSLIAKYERKVKLMEQELKRKEQELEEKFSKVKHWEEFESEQDPLKLLNKKGWDLEKVNKYAMENLGEEDLDPVAKRFKEVEDMIKKRDEEWETKLKKTIEEKEKEIQQKEYDSEIKQFKGEIKSFLAENKDQFELVSTYEADGPEGKIDGISLVYDVIYADLQRQVKDGRKHEELQPLDVKLAAEKVEQYLDSQVQKYLNLNKYKSRKAPEEAALESFLGTVKQTPKTIDSSFVPKSRPVEELSDREREQRAIELLKRGF
jgi:hypothetical protein